MQAMGGKGYLFIYLFLYSKTNDEISIWNVKNIEHKIEQPGYLVWHMQKGNNKHTAWFSGKTSELTLLLFDAYAEENFSSVKASPITQSTLSDPERLVETWKQSNTDICSSK